MSRATRPFVCFVLAILALAAPAAADLVNHGAHGEFFYDQSTGLYWFDPAGWIDVGRSTVDGFVGRASLWDWATSAQVDALVGQTAAAGATLEDVMGARQFTAGTDWPRWLGYHASADQPDGWLVQSTDNDSLDASGGQSFVSTFNPGAWLVSAADPTTAPRLEDLGDDGAYFHDADAGLFWSDPGNFVGMTREEVATWLSANPAWRWATAEEVHGLVGKMSAGDVPLTDVLGDPQALVGAGEPRWLGYYAQSAQPDGLLLEANTEPHFHVVTTSGTQTSAQSWNPGAWVVRTTDPTPVGRASWGAVKNSYR